MSCSFQLTLYGREACCLCKGLEERLRNLSLSRMNPPLELRVIDIDAADEITIDTTSADGHIAITSAHTAGDSILISANADADAVLNITNETLKIHRRK